MLGLEGAPPLPRRDGGATGTGEDLFVHEPAYGCFGANNFDFLLAAYHATWSDGNATAIKNEVSHLGEVFESMREAQPGERDLLVVGDFNLRPGNHGQAVPFGDRTEGTGSTPA